MSEYKEKIVDAITGEEIWRDYSKKEIAEIENNLKEIAKEQAEATVKETARQAIFDRLGLTADEAKLLLG